MLTIVIALETGHLVRDVERCSTLVPCVTLVIFWKPLVLWRLEFFNFSTHCTSVLSSRLHCLCLLCQLTNVLSYSCLKNRIIDLLHQYPELSTSVLLPIDQRPLLQLLGES